MQDPTEKNDFQKDFNWKIDVSSLARDPRSRIQLKKWIFKNILIEKSLFQVRPGIADLIKAPEP